MDYFPNKNEYLDKFKRLSDEQFGRLMRAAILYNMEEDAEVSEDIGLAFDCIVSDINKAKEAYLHKCEVNASNGAKGGRPKKSERLEEKPKKANGFLKTEKSQINKNKNKENKNIEKDIEREPETALEIALSEFRQYRKEMRKPLTPLAETKLMNQLQTLSNGDEAVMVQIIDQSIRNGWQGVFPLRDQWNKQAVVNYAQHERAAEDWAAMENKLFVNLDGV